MDWLAYIKYLQSILKKFHNITTPMDDLLIWYFWDGMRLSICAQWDKREYNLDNWQVVIKQAIYAKAKAAWQAFLLVWKSDAYYPHNQRYLKNEKSKDEKNSKAKKNHQSANNNNKNRNSDQSD